MQHFEDLLFVEEIPNKDEIECPVCLNILTDPHQVSCCGHNFCGPCIQSVIVKSHPSSCPLCKETGFKAFPDKKCSLMIDALEVYCIHKSSGCRWSGKLKSISSHLSQEDREGECDYQEVKCKHEDCQQRYQRRNLSQHEMEVCPYRPYQCEHCLLDGLYLSIMKHLNDSCALYPTHCPNNCASEKMPRCDLNDHLNVCPLQPVDCVFSWAGCNDKPLRKDVHVHSADTKHMTLLAVACGQLAKDNESLKEDNERIKETCKELKEENQRLSKDNDSFKYHIHCVMNVGSYPILPVEVASDKDVSHFYTGVCGHHMSAKVVLMKRSPASSVSISTTFKVFLAFHEGIYDTFNHQLPKIIATYKDKVLTLLDDTDIYWQLPHDVLNDVSKNTVYLPEGIVHKLVNLDGMYTRFSFEISVA